MVVDRTKELLRSVDVDGLDHLLARLTADERRELGAWTARSRRWCSDLAVEMYRERTADAPYRGYDEDYYRLPWMQVMIAIATLGPVAAADRLVWRDLWASEGAARRPRESALRMLRERPATWVAPFVQRSSERENVDSQILHDLAVQHGLGCPDGQPFLSDRVRGGAQAHAGDLLAFLRSDPLMPDLLYLLIGGGQAGAEAGVAQAAAVLADEGRVHRTRLLAACLEVLTRDTRVGSQRAVAELLTLLAVEATEVPGGFDYLAGVIATRHGSVAAALLPNAVALADGDQLTQLGGTVAARPERKLRQQVLTLLTADGVVGRLGASAVVDALHALSAGEEDAAFATKVARAIERLAPGAAGTGTAPDLLALGLWRREPRAAGLRAESWWWLGEHHQAFGGPRRSGATPCSRPSSAATRSWPGPPTSCWPSSGPVRSTPTRTSAS